MKTKNQMLAEIADREAREEAQNPLMYWSPFRERVDGITTTNKKQLEKLFRVKLTHSSWEDESFHNLAEAKSSVIAAVKQQMIFRRAKRKAEEIGLAYWPALLPSYDGKSNVDPLAYVAAEKALLAHGKKPWGTKLENQLEPTTAWDGTPVQIPGKNKIEHGGWDAMGHWGISPHYVGKCWFASGCKDTPKFRYLVRHTRGAEEVNLHGHKLKGLSLRQIVDLRRGQRWLQNHCHTSCFSTKAVIALGRISPAARKAAVEGLDFEGRGRLYEEAGGSLNGYKRTDMIRIRDLNWGAVKALQTMSKEEVTARYLTGRYAWQFLSGTQPLKGLERVLPLINREHLPEGLQPRVMSFTDFTVVAPEGYAFGTDEHGTKICEVENPEEDHHFSEDEAKGGACHLVKRLSENADRREE